MRDPTMVPRALSCSPKIALDVGCGEGRVCRALVALTSVTPTWISALSPDRGEPNVEFFFALAGINALLVVVVLWLVARERELAMLRRNLVACVSHEQRTPLAQIRLFSESLLCNRVPSAKGRQRALEVIGNESTRLLEIVDNVLHFHRGRQQVATESDEIDLHAFTRDVVASFRPLAESRRMRLRVSRITSEVIVGVHAGELRQVLLDLLDNAVKFGPMGQTVTIHTGKLAGAAVLTIQDEGHGVPPAARPGIFRLFLRPSQANRSGGARTGLAVVVKVLGPHGGQICVSNPLGLGALFTVTLPLGISKCDADPAPLTE